MKEIEDVRAKERQVEYHGNQYDGGLVENFPQVQKSENVTDTGKSRDIAAKKTNSGTYKGGSISRSPKGIRETTG